MGKGYLSAHMILGARGLGEVEDGRGGGGRAESRPPRVQGTKTRYLELGGGGGSRIGEYHRVKHVSITREKVCISSSSLNPFVNS